MRLDAAAVPYVRRVAEVHRDLPVRSARLVEGHGQNNVVLVVNDELVFRFPRYPDGVRKLRAEAGLLSRLGPRVSLAVPDPGYSCFEPMEVGHAFMGYRRIPGEPLSRDALEAMGDEEALRAMGEQLGGFLRCLHALPLDQVLPAEVERPDDWRRHWADLYARIRAHLFPRMRSDARGATERHFEEFLSEPRHGSIRPALVHGDFGTANILHDPAARRVTGVIDFGSAGVNDPAVDLAAVLWGPEPFVAGIASAYPGVDEMRDRMRFYAGTFALQEALFGAEQGDAEALRRGLAAYV